ncbi:MAG TPA: hypothetical protein VGF67_10585 [Ktedonobacteraceae bacterium]|jgi:hypothetical protein
MEAMESKALLPEGKRLENQEIALLLWESTRPSRAEAGGRVAHL